MEIKHLVIPGERLVPGPERYKVLDVINACSRRKGRIGYTEEIIQTALVMPNTPGGGGWTTGFEMMLVRIRDGKLSTNAADVANLMSRGVLGFVASGTGFVGFELSNERTWQHYDEQGYGDRIRELRDAVDQHREILEGVNPVQEEWEDVARTLAPTLAKLFDFKPDKLTFRNLHSYYGLRP